MEGWINESQNPCVICKYIPEIIHLGRGTKQPGRYRKNYLASRLGHFCCWSSQKWHDKYMIGHVAEKEATHETPISQSQSSNCCFESPNPFATESSTEFLIQWYQTSRRTMDHFLASYLSRTTSSCFPLFL